MSAAPRKKTAAIASLDVEGPTIQQAIQKALTQLHVPRNQVRVKVLAEGEPGLFGMRGNKPAKVRVTLKTPSEPRAS